MVGSELIEEIVAGDSPGLVPFSADQYHEMIRAGIIPDGSPVELIDGLVVWKDRGREGGKPMGHDPRHALLIKRLIQLLQVWASSVGCHIQVQLPVALSDVSEPEPDLALIFGTPDDFADRHPGPADVAVAIEVADSSLRIDRTTKLRQYAKAGIAAYWIVNLQKNQIEVYERADSDRELYAVSSVHRPGETVQLKAGEAVLSIELAGLLA